MKYLVILLPLLFSCSAEKRLARLIKQHPELVKSDTVYKTINVISPVASVDTVFKTTVTKDTVVIKDHQLTVKYFNNGTTTYIKGVCDTVKTTVEVPVIVNTVTPAEKYIPNFYLFSTWACYLILLLEAIALYVAYKRK